MPNVSTISSSEWKRPSLIQSRTGEYSFNDIRELCAFLSAEIRASKMTYKKISEKALVCPATVSHMASGTTIYPRAGTVFQILRVLGFEVVVRK